MSKELRAMLEGINNMKDEVKNLYAEGKDAEAQAKMDELEAAQAKFENLKKLEDVQAVPAEPKAAPVSDPVHDFAEAARRRFQNVGSEGTQADGGYTVPEDIKTQVEKLRDATFSLRQLVRVESVRTMSGARTFQVKSHQAAWASVAEMGAIGAKNTPTFDRYNYTIEKYAGIFPVSNELLADSDANITNIITEWIADGARVTENSLILAALNTKTGVAATGIDDIKTAINVTLGQAYKPNLKIVTNDDGLNFLDKLKDDNLRYLLTPDISNPGQLRLSCGAQTFPLVIVPNGDLPTNTTAPFYIGDFAEAITLFDRQQLSILASNVASMTGYNAFENDETLFRAIIREDVVVRDANAFVKLNMTI